MVNTTTEETACNVTKSVVCNAIQAESYSRRRGKTDPSPYDPPTDAEKEACTYAPHACNSVAQNL